MEPQMPLWLREIMQPHILSIPPYVAGKPVAELTRELGISDAIKMASNENPLGPSPEALRVIREHLPSAHVYPESSGPLLRATLAEHYGCDQDSVILGNGSDELMQLISHILIRPGDEAIIGAHTFSMYRICVESFGGTMVPVPMKDHRFDLTAMADAVTERTRLIFITVPNNPTGTIVTRTEMKSFMDRLPDKGIVLVVDEAYREYAWDEECANGLEFIGGTLPVLVLRTFSKIYGLAGLRVGYGFSEPWVIELMNRVRPPFNVNSLAQTAAAGALADVDHVRRSLEVNRSGMEFLNRELKAMGIEVIPSHGNFVSLCLERDAGPIYQGLLREGVIVRHLASFGMERCIRVTVGLEEHNIRFISALKRILARDEE